MRLTQICLPSCVKVPLKGRDKYDIISQLINLLDDNSRLLDKEAVTQAVFAREKIRSTGIGSGIAIPHGKSRAVKELVMAFGIAHEPIDFQSIDHKPVSIVILLVSPENQTGPHIQALAKISRLLLDEPFRHCLLQATHPEQAYQLLLDKENEPA